MPRSNLKRFVLGFSFPPILWLIGLGFFINFLPPAKLKPKCEVIIVFTGAKKRIPYALDLLEHSGAKEMLISGVDKNVELRDLFGNEIDENLKRRIHLGYAAHDTRTNALETYLWVKEHGYGNICVVTHQYHMPRSLLELKEYFETEQLQAIPVLQERSFFKSVNSLYFLVTEYQKFCIVYIKQKLKQFVK